MGHLNRRTPMALLIVIASLVIALGPFASVSAASTQSTSLTTFKVKASKIMEPPATTWRPISVKLSAYQGTRFTFGSVTLVDYKKNVWIRGSIKALYPILGGFQYEGCGQAHGSLSGDVCYTGAAQVQPNGSKYDTFSMLVTSGGTYQITGSVPAGSVQTSS